MKSERNILIAFILNVSFSIFEFIGGIFTGSVAIVSDAVHDLGDGVSIGLSYFLEKKSKKAPDEKYTFGYGRYSVLGGLITLIILLLGSALVIYNAVLRIFNPTEINYDGMIIFAVIGVVVNFSAALVTHGGETVNQRAVNLHMLEDVLGWVIVLIGAVIMKFTDVTLIDPLMCIGVSLFIFANAAKNLKGIADIFLGKVPNGMEIADICEHLGEIDGVIDVHHVHLWSIDGVNHLASLHIVTDEEPNKLKEKAKAELYEHGIVCATVEIEKSTDECRESSCSIEHFHATHHTHHHH